MTKSRVENLLCQMSLKEPSADLNSVIESVLDQQSEPLNEPGDARRVPWQFVSAVAIACLMIGVAVGRATVSSAVGGERAVVGASSEAPQPSGESDTDAVLEAAMGIKDGASLDGPRVAILCSQQTRTVPGSEEKRCTRCHSGVTDGAVIRSGHGAVQRFHRQLCARCHDMSGVLENWQLPEVNDVITNEAWHGDVGVKAPGA